MDHFERSGLSFDVRDSGPPEGEPVLLLHGFPQDASSWIGVAKVLNEAGLRTLAPDQRGYSPGARPPGRRAYVTGELADDALALLAAAGLESAHVVGHDWGGIVAWTLAGRDPQRVRSLTALSTPHPAAFLRSIRTSRQGLKSWYMAALQLPVLPELMIPRALAPALIRTGLPPGFAEHNARRMSEPGALTAALNWYRAMPYSLRGPQHRSPVPTSYVWGQHDPFLGRAAAEATAGFVTGPYRFVELDAGHWLPETHAEEVGSLILEQIGQL